MFRDRRGKTIYIVGTMTHQSKKNKKILMYGKHIAWIEEDMLRRFDKTIKNTGVSRNEWIKNQCFLEFGIKLDGTKSLEELDIILLKNLYSDKGEWLRTKIRDVIKKHKN